MAEQEQEKKDREIEDFEAIEIEEEDLEDISGGFPDLNCGCSSQV